MEKHHEVILPLLTEEMDFHVLVDKNTDLEKAHELTHYLEDDISKRFESRVLICVELCIGNCEECSQECQKKLIYSALIEQ